MQVLFLFFCIFCFLPDSTAFRFAEDHSCIRLNREFRVADRQHCCFDLLYIFPALGGIRIFGMVRLNCYTRSKMLI